jgi:hypothetical protein
MSAVATPRPRILNRLVAMTIYAFAMGWLEAVIVVYIRSIVGIAHTETIPAPDEVMRRFTEKPWLLPTEQTRELATMAMLAGVAWLSAWNFPTRFGAFLILFGVWDIAYYIGLYALLRWPPSLGTMDLLFLIPPHPWWYQPVWVPVAISLGMIYIGLRLYRWRARGEGLA